MKFTLFLSVILLAICLTSCTSDNYISSMEKGNQELKNNDYQKAIDSFSVALKEKPGDKKAMKQLLKAKELQTKARLRKGSEQKSQFEEASSVPYKDDSQLRVYHWTGSDENGSFNVDELIDLDNNGQKEQFLIYGGGLDDDSSLFTDFYIQIKGNGIDTRISCMNQSGEPNVYLADLNKDGYYEIIYNDGYRQGDDLELYTFNGHEINSVTEGELIGTISKIEDGKIYTEDNKTFTFNGEALLDNNGHIYANHGEINTPSATAGNTNTDQNNSNGQGGNNSAIPNTGNTSQQVGNQVFTMEELYSIDAGFELMDQGVQYMVTATGKYNSYGDFLKEPLETRLVTLVNFYRKFEGITDVNVLAPLIQNTLYVKASTATKIVKLAE